MNCRALQCVAVLCGVLKVAIPCMTHIWMGRVAHVESHVAQMDDSCRTHGKDMFHVWMRHVAHIDMSCRTHERDKSHIRISHVAHMYQSCRKRG